jgi:hypothetical protein
MLFRVMRDLGFSADDIAGETWYVQMRENAMGPQRELGMVAYPPAMAASFMTETQLEEMWARWNVSRPEGGDEEEEEEEEEDGSGGESSSSTAEAEAEKPKEPADNQPAAPSPPPQLSPAGLVEAMSLKEPRPWTSHLLARLARQMIVNEYAAERLQRGGGGGDRGGAGGAGAGAGVSSAARAMLGARLPAPNAQSSAVGAGANTGPQAPVTGTHEPSPAGASLGPADPQLSVTSRESPAP